MRLGIRFLILWCICAAILIWLKGKFFPQYGVSEYVADSIDNFTQPRNSFIDSLVQPRSERNYVGEHTSPKSVIGMWEIVILGVSYIGAKFFGKLIDTFWKIFVADFLERKFINFKEYFSSKKKK